MKELYLINKKENTAILTSIEQVAEQSGISEQQFQNDYNGDPLKVNEDLYDFEYMYDVITVLKNGYCIA